MPFLIAQAVRRNHFKRRKTVYLPAEFPVSSCAATIQANMHPANVNSNYNLNTGGNMNSGVITAPELTLMQILIPKLKST